MIDINKYAATINPNSSAKYPSGYVPPISSNQPILENSTSNIDINKYAIPANEQKPYVRPINATESGLTPEEERALMIEQGIPVSSERRYERTGKNIPTLGGELLRDPIKLAARFGTNIIGAGQIIAGEEPTEALSNPYLGRIKAIGQEGNFGQKLMDSAGVGLEAASYLPIGAGINLGKNTLMGIVKQGVKPVLKNVIKPLAIEGGTGFGMYALGKGLQENLKPEEIAKQTSIATGIGLLVGPAFGLVLHGAGSILPREVDIAINELYDKAVKPSKRATLNIANKQIDNNIESAKIIYTDIPNIVYKDANDVVYDSARAPKTLMEQAQAVSQTKDNIWNRMTATLDSLKARVSIDEPLIQIQRKIDELGPAANQTPYLEAYLNKYRQDPMPTSARLNTYITDLNSDSAPFFKSGSPSEKAQAAASVANLFRSQLDKTAQQLGTPEVSLLRRQYGALASTEKDLMSAVYKQIKYDGGGAGRLADLFSGEEILRGIFTLSPKSIVAGASLQAVKKGMAWLNNPDRFIEKMYRVIDNAIKKGKEIERMKSPYSPQERAGLPMIVPGRGNYGKTNTPDVINLGGPKDMTKIAYEKAMGLNEIKGLPIVNKLGEGSTQMFSNNVKDDMTWGEAISKMESPEQKKLRLASVLINNKYNAKTLSSESFIGDTTNYGTENAIVQHIKVDPAKAILLAAEKGLKLKQKTVLNFDHSPTGTDFLVSFKMPEAFTNEQIRGILDSNRLGYRSINPNTNEVIIYSQNGDNLPIISNLTKQYGTRPTIQRGVGQFIGSDESRAEAAKVYERILSNRDNITRDYNPNYGTPTGKEVTVYSHIDITKKPLGNSKFFTPDIDATEEFNTGKTNLIKRKVNEANLYQGTSSEDYIKEIGLIDKPLPPDLQKLTGLKTPREVINANNDGVNPMGSDFPGEEYGKPSAAFLSNPNLSWVVTQTLAERNLKKAGYKGAHWSYEDDLIPEQYQLWSTKVGLKIPLLDKIKEIPNQQGGLMSTNSMFDQEGRKALTEDKLLSVDPIMNLKRDVPVTDVHGKKSVIPEGEPLTPYILKDNKILLKDGVETLVNKSVYENVKRNSEIQHHGIPFAPELDGDIIDVRNRPEPLTKKQKDRMDKLENNRQDLRNKIMDAENRIFGLMQADKKDPRIAGAKKALVNLRSMKSKQEKAYDLLRKQQYANNPTKHYTGDRVMAGGKNYSEILIKAKNDLTPNEKEYLELKKIKENYEDFTPDQRARWEEFKIDKISNDIEIKQSKLFTPPEIHYRDALGTYSTARVQEYKYKNQKTLLVDELQSDWNAKVADEGAKDSDVIEVTKEIQDVGDKNPTYHYTNKKEDIRNPNSGLLETKYTVVKALTDAQVEDYATKNGLELTRGTFDKNSMPSDLSKYTILDATKEPIYIYKIRNKNDRITDYDIAYTQAEADRRVARKNSDLVYNNPKLKEWNKAAVAAVLQEAVKRGDKRVAWTNPAQQKYRWTLERDVDVIDYAPSSTNAEETFGIEIGNGIDITFVLKNGGRGEATIDIRSGRIIDSKQRELRGKKLSEIIPNDVAEQIITNPERTGIIPGEGLKFGGKWAEVVYGRMTNKNFEILTGKTPEQIDLGLSLKSMRDSGESVPELYKHIDINNKVLGKATPSNIKIGDIISTDIENRTQGFSGYDTIVLKKEIIPDGLKVIGVRMTDFADVGLYYDKVRLIDRMNYMTDDSGVSNNIGEVKLWGKKFYYSKLRDPGLNRDLNEENVFIKMDNYGNLTKKIVKSLKKEKEEPQLQWSIPIDDSVIRRVKEMPNVLKQPSGISPFMPTEKINTQGGSIRSMAESWQPNLSTKLIEDLKGRNIVSKNYIKQRINSSDINLKGVEKDITTRILDKMPDNVNVKDFSNAVKDELVPLKLKRLDDEEFATQFHYITLDESIRGNVKNYSEHIWESPIKTSAGDIHFSDKSKNYFGHTRVEDMTDKNIRRIIEVQSDLYQKGNLEREFKTTKRNTLREGNRTTKDADAVWNESKKAVKKQQKLKQYNDPTAHYRMIREEIALAAKDGKTKLQFPTGETAMKVEGLGSGTKFWDNSIGDELEVGNLAPGKIINDYAMAEGTDWVIINVEGKTGKFDAMQKDDVEILLSNYGLELDDVEPKELKRIIYEDDFEGDGDTPGRILESFDISGKIDTNNPIYKFYNEEVRNYLTKNFKAKEIKDAQEIKWIEVPIDKKMKELPVLSFGKMLKSPLFAGAGIGVGMVAGAGIIDKQKKKKSVPFLSKNK